MEKVKNCCEGCEHFEPDAYKMKKICCGKALKDGKFVAVDHSTPVSDALKKAWDDLKPKELNHVSGLVVYGTGGEVIDIHGEDYIFGIDAYDDEEGETREPESIYDRKLT